MHEGIAEHLRRMEKAANAVTLAAGNEPQAHRKRTIDSIPQDDAMDKLIAEYRAANTPKRRRLNRQLRERLFELRRQVDEQLDQHYCGSNYVSNTAIIATNGKQECLVILREVPA